MKNHTQSFFAACIKGKFTEMLVGLLLAIFLLLAYSTSKIDPKGLALGEGTTIVVESWKNKPFTAHSPELIKKLVEDMSASETEQVRRVNWLWLGNSQLHAINQLKEGDHLAPYWAREALPCPECVVPLGISVPNANFQEFLLLSQYVESKVKIKGLVIEMPFIGLREDGIRDELDALVDNKLKTDLSTSSAGADVIKSVDISESAGKALGTDQNVSTRDENFQARVENSLETKLGGYFSLWRTRGDLKTYFLVDLYYLKNWVFGIKQNSVRKVIKVRYDRNMSAMEDILKRSKNEGISVILYIAPIRQDMQIPYDKKEYDSWKVLVETLASEYGARFLNLEKQVPVEYWGTYGADAENIDFMHFQGPGHQLVGRYIAKYLD